MNRGNEIPIKKGDEYLFQQNVSIDTPVDGNVFIFANEVTIDSQIGGDAFICANTINIADDGFVLSNLFACANTINIKGSVYNIYAMANSLTIDGFVYRDVRSMSNSLNINGMIGRNVFANCSTIHFKEKTDTSENVSITSYGSIQGNLNYFSNEELHIPEESVSGKVEFTSLKHTVKISDYIYSLGAFLVCVIIIWLLGLWLSPKLLLHTTSMISFKKALQIIGLGILVPIIITLLSVIILLIPITSQFTMFLLSILALLFFISTSVAMIDINNGICNKLKIDKTICKLGFLILTTLIFWLLTLVPYVGIVLSLIATIWGIGSISYKLFINESIQKTSKDEKKEEEKSTKNNTEKKS